MISKMMGTGGVLLMAVCFVPLSYAAEHGGVAQAASTAPKDKSSTTMASVPATDTTTTTTTTTTTNPNAVVPAVTTPAAPALRPIVITFSGDVSAVDAKNSPAMLTVKDRYNVTKEMKVPTDAKIMEGSATKALSDLKVGSKVTVEYTYDVAKGDRTVQSISLNEAAAPASAGS